MQIDTYWDKGQIMEVGGKLLTGTAATVLLALVGHYTTSPKIVAELETATQTELAAQGMDNVSATFSHDPWSRMALLDGNVDDDIKQKALSTAATIPGVSNARWRTDEDLAASGDGDGDGGKQGQVATCQGNVNEVIESKKLSFRSGSAYVSPASNRILDEVATALKPCDGLSIAVGGHTDDNGDADINKSLSQERAERVQQGLVDRGIAQDSITAIGYGSEKPLIKGNDAQNRRIEFTIGATNSADAKASQGE